MVNELVLFGGITLFLLVLLVIYKKPDVIKKDIKKPLSISNFSLKKTFVGDWKSFFIFLVLMFLVWGYANDTAVCREMINDFDNVCRQYMNSRSNVLFNENYLNEIKFTGENNGTQNSWGYNQSGCPDIIPPNS